MKNIYIVLIIVLFGGLIYSPVYATTRCVPSGCSPNYSTVTAAIAASSSGDIIQLASGTITENFTVNISGLTIQGDINNPTNSVISASGTGNVVSVSSGTDNTVLQYFKITGGDLGSYTDTRAALKAYASASNRIDGLTIRGITITDYQGAHRAPGVGSGATGIGVHLGYVDNLLMENNTITPDRAEYSAFFDWRIGEFGTATVRNNTFGCAGFGTIRISFVSDMIFEKNYVHSMDDPQGSDNWHRRTLYMRDSKKLRIRYNVIDGNAHTDQTGIYEGTVTFTDDNGGCGSGSYSNEEDWIFHNNLVIGHPNAFGALKHENAIEDILIYNNIVYNPSGTGVGYYSDDACTPSYDYYNNQIYAATTRDYVYSTQSGLINVQNEITTEPNFTASGEKPSPWWTPTNGSATQVDVGMTLSNSMCTGNNSPFNCCTGSGTGTCSTDTYTGTDYDGKPKYGGKWDIGAFEWYPSAPANADDYTVSTITDSNNAIIYPSDTEDFFGFKLDICDGVVGNGCAASSGNNTGSFAGVVLTLNCTGDAGTGNASSGDISCVSIYDDSGGSVGSYDGTDAKLNSSCATESAGVYTATFDSAETVTDTESGYYWVVITMTAVPDTSKFLSPCLADQNAIVITAGADGDTYADTRQLPTASDLTVTDIDPLPETPGDPVPCVLKGTIKGSFQ
jgi:hypothetical protein